MIGSIIDQTIRDFFFNWTGRGHGRVNPKSVSHDDNDEYMLQRSEYVEATTERSYVIGNVIG